MISKLSISSPSISLNSQKLSAPSFGFAKLNDIGRATADSFGYQHNEFLDVALFRKQGIFKKSALSSKLSDGEKFSDICKTYGCTNNSKTNAEFINSQILSSKSSSALKKLNSDELKTGLSLLYMSNYDNPELSLNETKALLQMLRESLEPGEYIKHIGLLEAGTIK